MKWIETCDICGDVLTETSETSDLKEPRIKYFHDNYENTVCSECVWAIMNAYGRTQHPDKYHPGSLNAGWMPMELSALKIVAEALRGMGVLKR